MIHFTIEARRTPAEGMGFEPTCPLRAHGLANRPGQPYPATFRIVSGPTGNRTRISATARAVSSRWTMSPSLCQWTAGESNPDRLVASQASSRWTSSPCCWFTREVRPGIEPGLPPYRGGVPPKTPTDQSVQMIPDGVEPSLSWMSIQAS